VSKKKKRRRKKKTMKKNMMKMIWLYSSRNSISSSREEDLTREKEKRSQGQRGCATIVARIGISLRNEHMRGSKKTMTKKRSLTKATRKTRNILRRSLMIKLILAKNGTQVMRVSNCHTPFRDSETKPPYVCPGCFIHTYSNNMINRCHVQ
jgi:hypothetical protein